MEERIAAYLASRMASAEEVRVSHLYRIPGGASRETWMFKATWREGGERRAHEFILRRDPPEVARVVDHRHEEVGGRDHAALGVELPHGRIVAGLGADQELAERSGRRLARQQLLQHGGCELAAAAAAMGEAGQPDGTLGPVRRR